MAHIGSNITIRGEIESSEDLVIEGCVDGPVWCEGLSVTVGPTAAVIGDIVARVITVLGTAEGTLIGTYRVDVGPSASLRGRVLAPAFVLADGGSFNGSVHPQHLDAALNVARHRRVKTASWPQASQSPSTPTRPSDDVGASRS